MAVETFVAIAERRNHRRDSRQLVEHAIHVNVARVHHEIDSGEDLEDPFREMLAGFGNMSVRNEADSHYALLRARYVRRCRIVKPITHRNSSQFSRFRCQRATLREFGLANSHQILRFSRTCMSDLFEKSKPSLFVSSDSVTIRNRRIDNATFDRRIGENHIIEKLPDYWCAQTAMVKLNLADKQIDTSDPLRRRNMQRILRILGNRILLDISNWRVAMNDHEASNVFLAVDTRRIFRDYLIECQRFVRPPLDDVRSVQPSMHQRQIAAVERSKMKHSTLPRLHSIPEFAVGN